MLWRSLRRQRVFSIINLAGLALGLLATLFIADFIHHEYQYDRHFTHADRIFRISMHNHPDNGYDMHWARLTTNFINELPETFPEVETLVRFQNYHPRNVRVGESLFKETHAYSTDAEALALFDYPMLQGSANAALAEPYSIVLTQATARKYFGRTQVVGETVEIMDGFEDTYTPYKVTGVIADPPSSTHLPITLLTSFATPENRAGWAYTYVLLRQPEDALAVAEKMPAFIADHEEDPESLSLSLMPLTDIHLHGHLAREIIPNGWAWQPRLFGAVALFILLVALINYMNLSLAQQLRRAREVGVRKVLGSNRGRLLRQFILESVVMACLAAVVAAVGVVLLQAPYQQLAGFAFSLPITTWVVGLGLAAILVGLAAGIYPALRLSQFAPIQVLKGGAWQAGASSRINLRHLLVGVQFVISLLLLVMATIAYQQNHYLLEKDLGFQTDQVLAIQELPPAVQQAYPSLSESLLREATIQQVSAVMQLPGQEIRDTGFIYAAGNYTQSEDAPVMDVQIIDRGFVELMDMKLVAGTDFPASLLRPDGPKKLKGWQDLAAMLETQPQAYLLNETAMRMAGWEDPQEALGQEFGWSNGILTFNHGPVVGIVQDFHQESLRNAIEPVVMVYEPQLFNYILIKVRPNEVGEAQESIRRLWAERFPSLPLDLTFLDEEFAQLYTREGQQTRLLGVFTTLAVIIAFLGLMGMLAYTLKLRASELAIRRVLGAEARNLLWLLGREYSILLGASLLLAIPGALYLASLWLEEYSYRISVTATPFMLSASALGGLIVFNLLWQTLRHLREHPVRSLREE